MAVTSYRSSSELSIYDMDTDMGDDYTAAGSGTHFSGLPVDLVARCEDKDAQSRARCTAPRSRFLDLPTELRLAIYEYALPEPILFGVGGCYNCIQSTVPKIFGGEACKQAVQAPLTRVSRQLREETLSLFYRLNRFVLAVHYRRARSEVDKFIDSASQQPVICTNLRNVIIKHRFGMLDYRGTIEFDFKQYRIVGPKLWYNSIPPLLSKEIERTMDAAREAERSDDLIAKTLRQLVAICGLA